MIELCDYGAYLINGTEIIRNNGGAAARLREAGVTASPEEGRRGTITYGILEAHNRGKAGADGGSGGGGGGGAGDADTLRITFDSLTSHDITYVGIIQTARASGLKSFPVPYILTNCHNTLCAVGGTINEDDHRFALSAAEKYGGVYVPPHLAVIHSYNREMMAGCGKMILGSDSHTRYGALGTMGVGEGGGELAKQLLGKTYDIARPEVIAVYLTGTPPRGVGPQDIALALVASVFERGMAKNKVLEFVGDGVASLDMDFRNGIDVMTTETACWSSIWKTDERAAEYLAARGRAGDYRELSPAPVAYYDGLIRVDLSMAEPFIALPFHPSNVYSIRELKRYPEEILAKVDEDAKKVIGAGADGRAFRLRDKIRSGDIWVDQAMIAGCSGGTFGNITAARDILAGFDTGNGPFSLSVYPDSQPVFQALLRCGAIEDLAASGAVIRSAFCGPCFGAGDTPANGAFSIRHTTRNFPNREGSKPNEGQMAFTALMDARSIAATARNHGKLTSAFEVKAPRREAPFAFDGGVYEKRVYNGWGRANPEAPLVLGPNIKDWPPIPALPESLVLEVACVITDPVTTTDELIPSGETSSFRSNPLRLAEFTLSRKDPLYVGRAKKVQALERLRAGGGRPEARPEAQDLAAGELAARDLAAMLEDIRALALALPGGAGTDARSTAGPEAGDLGIGSAIFARKPGDGSAREQAASCQRVLGGAANFALEYATKRYRSNLINWGILPFLVSEEDASVLSLGARVFFPGIRAGLLSGAESFTGYVLGGGALRGVRAALGPLTGPERQILAEGCLINYYAH